jgi:hypothetical protein
MQVSSLLSVAILLAVSAISVNAQSIASLPEAPRPVHLTTATAGVVGTPIELAEETAPLPDLARRPDLRSALPEMPALLLTAPQPPSRPKVIDKKFIVLTALVFGLTAMDIEMTQRCMHRGTCVELNPTLPHSRGGMYAVNTATNLGVMYLAFHRRNHEKRDWWIAPLIDIGAHVGGVGSNIRFLGK